MKVIARHHRELSFIDPLAPDRARDAKASLKIDKLLPPKFGDRDILSRPNLVRGLKDRRSILSIRGRLIRSQNMGFVSVYRMLRILEIRRLPPLLLPPPTPSSHPPLSPSFTPFYHPLLPPSYPSPFSLALLPPLSPPPVTGVAQHPYLASFSLSTPHGPTERCAREANASTRARGATIERGQQLLPTIRTGLLLLPRYW